MDNKKYMLLVNGQDKTDSVASFHFQGGMCEVVYTSSPKSYRYHAGKVRLLKAQNHITRRLMRFWILAPFTVSSGMRKKPLHIQKDGWNSRKTVLRTRNRQAFLNTSKKRQRRSVW